MPVEPTQLRRRNGKACTIAYIFFRALQNMGTGRTAATVTSALLVDRNALETSKSTIDQGNCWAVIRDDAPVLVQPPVWGAVYLPLVLRRWAWGGCQGDRRPGGEHAGEGGEAREGPGWMRGQAHNEFTQYVTPDDGREFTEVCNVQHLQSNAPDRLSQVYITTVQRL